MHYFSFHDNALHAEQVSLVEIAEQQGTPTFVYSANTIREHYKRLDDALAPIDHEVAYAVKANSNVAVLSLLNEMGASFDIVSGGELYRVVKAGGDPAKCTFAGVGKTREEIEYALELGIHAFNVESEAELNFINKVAGEMGKTAPVSIRVNPNVDAKTHKYISTGKSENKFGIDFDVIADVFERASKMEHVQLKGLQMHIGSQLTTVQPFRDAVTKVAPLAADLKEKYGIEFFSIGGGIGIIYDPALESGSPDWWDANHPEDMPLTTEKYASELIPILKPLGLKILLEPGRYIVGNAGVMITRCLYEKRGKAKTFKIVDAGMNDLIRPALYQGYHEIVPLTQGGPRSTVKTDVVGPVCETGDFFCQDRELPDFEEGELLALMSAGAYGAVMGSTYNSRPLPTEVLVDGDQATVIRKRQTMDDILAQEIF
ncbi:diaminopimelate decarboxylase [Roseibacillus persicicus]|uniref:Diaminopimelate decarboxylase n=1 Tax=Roseibacillus persicicus TaxID=454148 RepID=A0A918WN99_9BACT|nr:diaminopimelate decarboxylase [Roseibacillus persicicus]MDQ8191141.1 diaminopimelate decarboxylase [Roseibacillus persicicus]GHC59016.1 diaminopimelate decarboxylase [Roseibacillus persicicus]